MHDAACKVHADICSYARSVVTRSGGAMVAQQTSNLKVVGSIPTSSVIFIFLIMQVFHTERNSDQKRPLTIKRMSGELSVHLAVYVDSIKFEKSKVSIPNTKTKLEIEFGQSKAKTSFECKSTVHPISIQKTFKFAFKHEDELRLSIIRKNPLVSISTIVNTD